MVNVTFKIDHNTIENGTITDKIFGYGNKSLSPVSAWRYKFTNTTDSNVYIAVATIIQNNEQYQMPLLVSKNPLSVLFYANPDDSTQDIEIGLGGSVTFNNEVYYYNEFISTVATWFTSNIHYPAATMQEATLNLLADEYKYTFNKREIVNIEYLSQSNTDASEISYGAIPDTGSVELLDINDRIINLINNGEIGDFSLRCSIYIGNSLFQKVVTTNNEYDPIDKHLKLSLSNKFYDLSTIDYGRPYLSSLFQTNYTTVDSLNSVSIYDLLIDLFCKSNLYPKDYDVDSIFSELAQLSDYTLGNIKDYLEELIIQYPYINTSNALDVLNKLCEVGNISLIEYGGKLKMVNARPLLLGTPIRIPKSKQYSSFVYSVINHNAINKVTINSTVFSKRENTSDKVFQSSMLTICDNNGNYIGNNDGVNNIVYDVDGGVIPNVSTLQSNWFQFNYEKNIANLEYIPDFRQEHIAEAISIAPYCKPFDRNDFQPLNSWNEYEDISTIPYHDYLIINNNLVNAFGVELSTQGNNQILKIRGQINWFENFSHGSAYIDKIYFYIKSENGYSISKQEFSVGNGENIFSENGNELLQFDEGAENKIINTFANNIISDYGNGVSNGTITISYGDYYDENNNKVIDGNKGEMLQVGNIIKIEGNNKIWKITGRKFRKKGTPFIDLEVMQVNYAVFDESVYDALLFTIVNDGHCIVKSSNSSVNKNIEIPRSVRINSEIYKVIGIENEGFWQNQHLPNVTFEDDSNLEYIGEKAFQFCSELKSIKIPNSVQRIEFKCFDNCYDLESVLFEEHSSLSSIGEAAFGSCYALSSITIPESVQTIGDFAFRECTSLTSITIPESVQTIGDFAFAACESLYEITINSPFIYDAITGDSFSYFTEMFYIKSSIDTGTNTYLNENFIMTHIYRDGIQYNAYSKLHELPDDYE